MPPDRDMSEPAPATPSEARKKVKEYGDKTEHYDDSLTETDAVPYEEKEED